MKTTGIYQKAILAFFCILLLFLGLYSTKGFDNFPDNFGMRKNLISWAMNFKFLVLRDNFFNDLYTRDQQWLNYIGDVSIDDYQNTKLFSLEELETIHVKFRNIHDAMTARGIKFYLVIPPNKNTIYPDDLEEIAPKQQSISRLDQLIEYEKAHSGLEVIDLRSELLEAKKNNLVYWSTDTHWNSYGSWVGYSKIMSVISQDFSTIVVNPLESFRVSENIYVGEITNISGNLMVNEITQTFSLRNPRNVRNESGETSKNISILTSYVDDPELPTSLVFRDSFYNGIYGLMSQHFSKSVCLLSREFDHSMVDEVQPDLVIFEITERAINQLIYLLP